MSSDPPATAEGTTIYVDADACPVKDEAVRVAERHGLDIHFVSNAFMRLPEGPLIHRVVVAEGPDAADDWIAERIEARDIAVTADIPLAARCLKKGAAVIGPTGKPFTEAGIGMALAMRELSRTCARPARAKATTPASPSRIARASWKRWNSPCGGRAARRARSLSSS